MPVHIGIMCDVCRMVHFIATSSTIKPSPMNKEMYRLVCAPPCSEVREFRKDSMRPYRVTDTVFKTGHAGTTSTNSFLGIERKTADHQEEGLTQQGHNMFKS